MEDPGATDELGYYAVENLTAVFHQLGVDRAWSRDSGGSRVNQCGERESLNATAAAIASNLDIC
jgi:hypothetical protein